MGSVPMMMLESQREISWYLRASAFCGEFLPVETECMRPDVLVDRLLPMNVVFCGRSYVEKMNVSEPFLLPRKLS